MSIDQLHTILSGKQDTHISQMSTYLFTGTLVETRKILLKGNSTNYVKSAVTFSNHEDAHRNYGYTNLRFNGDPLTIKEIELDFTGYRFDRIYPQIIKKLSTFPILDNNILPSLLESDYKILAQHLGDLEIVFDVMEITNPVTDTELCEILYSFTQYTGLETVVNLEKLNKIRLPFNHPTTKITVISNHPIFDVTLDLDLNTELLTLSPVDGSNLVYEYRFDKSINFSKIDMPSIKFQIEDFRVNKDGCKENSTDINIFAESFNIARIHGDQIVIVYS